jgi:hypothetical protein
LAEALHTSSGRAVTSVAPTFFGATGATIVSPGTCAPPASSRRFTMRGVREIN